MGKYHDTLDALVQSHGGGGSRSIPEGPQGGFPHMALPIKPTTQPGGKGVTKMKSFGKYILLLLAHIMVLFIGAIVLSLIFYALMQTKIGYYFVGHLTGGAPDITVVFLPCIISFFSCSAIADRLHAEKSLYALGVTLICANIVFLILNIFHGEAIMANIIQIVLGGLFIVTNRK